MSGTPERDELEMLSDDQLAVVDVTHVSVHRDRVCIQTAEQGLDCDLHDHVGGRRELSVEVEPVRHSDAHHAAFAALVGKRCRLVPIEDSP